MNVSTKDIALQLTGTGYGEIPDDIIQDAALNGLVIVYGASDDLMEFRGAIYDELDVYMGGVAYLSSGGLIKNKCDNDECPYFHEQQTNAVRIEAIWAGNDTVSWTYKTSYSLPHETFEMYDDGELYCIGIVFALRDVQEATP